MASWVMWLLFEVESFEHLWRQLFEPMASSGKRNGALIPTWELGEAAIVHTGSYTTNSNKIARNWSETASVFWWMRWDRLLSCRWWWSLYRMPHYDFVFACCLEYHWWKTMEWQKAQQSRKTFATLYNGLLHSSALQMHGTSHFLMDYVDKMPPMDRITKMILTSSLTQLEPRNSSMTFLKELNSMEHFLISTEMAPCALEPGIFITNMNIIVNIHACLNLKRTGDEWELDSGLAWRGHSCDSSWSVQRLPTSTSPCWCSDDFPRTLDASVFNIVNHSSPTSATPSFFVRSCMLTSTTVWRSCVGICCERFVLVSSTQPSLQNEPCVERYSIHGCAHTWSPPWPSLYHYNFGLHACCQHCKLIVHTNGCAATSWDWRLLPHAHCPGGWQHWHGGWATAIARRLWKQQRTQRGHQHSDLPPGWTRCALLCIKQDVHVHLGGGHPCKPNEKERCQMFSLCPGDPSWRSRDSRGSHHPPVSQRHSTWLCRKTCTIRSWNTFPPTTWTTFGAGSYQQEGSQGQSKFT